MKLFRLAALLSACLVILSACDGVGDKSTAELLLAAQAAIDDRRVAEARVHALNAAAQEPQNPSVRAVLGEVLLRANDAAVAEIEFEKAIELGLSSDHVYPLLAEALLAQGKTQELQGLELPPDISVPSQVSVLALQAESLVMAGRLPDAAELLKQIEALDAAVPDAVLAKARFLMALSRLEEAEGLIDGLVRARPDDYKAWLKLGQIRSERGDHGGAIAALDKAVELAYVPGIERQYRALESLRVGDVDAARADYQELVSRYPDAPIVAFLAGYFEYEVGSYGDAQSILDGVLAKDAAHFPSLLLAAAAYGQTGSMQIAKHYLDRLGRQRSARTSDQVAILEAFLSLRGGDANTADRLLDTVGQVPALNDYVAQLRIRTAAVIQGDLAPSGGDSSSIAAITLRPPPPKFALLETGRPAKVAADEALLQDAGAETARVYSEVRAAADRGDFDAAQAIAAAYLERRPQDPAAHLLVGVAAIARKDVAQAYQAYSQALALDPGFVPAMRSLATVQMLQGNYAEAAQLQAKIAELYPQDYQAYLAAAAAEVARNDLATAQRWLEQAVKLRPGAYEPVELLARLMGRRGDPAGALALLNRHSAELEDNTKFLALRARFALDIDDEASALADFGRLATLLPRDALIAVTYAGLLRDSGDTQAYEGELRRALEIEPRLDETREELAANAVMRNDLVGAKRILGSPEDHPDNPRLLALSAVIASKENRPAEAVDLARRVFELAPSNVNLIALARVQWAAGRKKEALAELSAWAKMHPDDLLTLNYLADSLLDMGQPEAAIALYETSLERNPQQPAVMNNLAWVLRETDLDRAHELAQGAVALAPDNKDLLDTLAVVEQLIANRN